VAVLLIHHDAGLACFLHDAGADWWRRSAHGQTLAGASTATLHAACPPLPFKSSLQSLAALSRAQKESGEAPPTTGSACADRPARVAIVAIGRTQPKQLK
jgi:hypothetical protein